MQLRRVRLICGSSKGRLRTYVWVAPKVSWLGQPKRWWLLLHLRTLDFPVLGYAMDILIFGFHLVGLFDLGILLLSPFGL